MSDTPVSIPATCIAPGQQFGPNFGYSLAIGQSWIAIGNPDLGQVGLFSREPAPKLLSILSNDDIAGFGYALAARNNRLIVGAYAGAGKDSTGAVFSFDEMKGLEEVARSDATLALGFSVAIGDDFLAYGTRTIAEPFVTDGDLRILSTTGTEAHIPTGHPDYFATALASDGQQVAASAPAIGPLGSLWLKPSSDTAATDLLTVPEDFQPEIQRRGDYVALSDTLCVLSGDTAMLQSGSVAWIGCQPDRGIVLEGQGPVATAGDLIAFAGSQTFDPDATNKTPVLLHDLSDPGGAVATVRLSSQRTDWFRPRSVAMTPNALAISTFSTDGSPHVFILDPRTIDFSAPEVHLTCN